MTKIWFINGAGRGFGREFAKAALSRGDKAAATASNPDLTQEFGDLVLPLALDVTDRDAVFDAVTTAQKTYGRLDVVVNNAGYGLFGAVEELPVEQRANNWKSICSVYCM